MNKRREVMRIAGWLAVLSGAAAMGASVLTDSFAIDFLGAYGLLFTMTGGWTLAGLSLLARNERRAAARQDAARVIQNQPTVLGR